MAKGWIGKPSPRSMQLNGRGWFSEMNKTFKDEAGTYAVMIRTLETEWGLVEHAAIISRDNMDIPWREKQRIKNEIFGLERIAVEVFPADDQLVDETNMYHLWVLPVGMKLPFTLQPLETMGGE